jgi:hypothetical protein
MDLKEVHMINNLMLYKIIKTVLNIRIAERKKHLKIYLVKRLAVVTSV